MIRNPSRAAAGLALLLIAGVSAGCGGRENGASPPATMRRMGDDVDPETPPDPPRTDAEVGGAVLRELAEERRRLDVASDDPSPLLEFASRAFQEGDILAAREVLDRWRHNHPGAVSPVDEVIARCDFRLGRSRSAEAIYRRLTELAPGDPTYAVGLSRVLDRRGRRDEARVVLEKAAAAVDSSTPEPMLALIRTWQQREDLPRALAAARDLHRRFPAHPGVALALGTALFRSRELGEARRVLEAAHRSGPEENGPAYYLAAVLADPVQSPRDLARAEHLLLELLDRKPDDVINLQRLGEIYAEQGRDRPAAVVFSRLLLAAPDQAGPRLQLAMALQRAGDTEGARRQRALAAPLLKLDQELVRLETAIRRQPDRAAPRLRFAETLERAGRLRRALPEFQAAASIEPGHAGARAGLIRFYGRFGLKPPPVPAGEETR